MWQVIDYSVIMRSPGHGNEGRASLIRKMWHDRIRGTKRNVEVKNKWLFRCSFNCFWNWVKIFWNYCYWYMFFISGMASAAGSPSSCSAPWRRCWNVAEICFSLPKEWSYWSVSSHIGPFVGILLLSIVYCLNQMVVTSSNCSSFQEHDDSSSPTTYAHRQIPQVTYAYLKYEWYSGKKPGDDKKRVAAFSQLQVSVQCYSST